MSRTYHRSSEREKNLDLIERRKLRSREYQQENGIFKEHISLSYVLELTKKGLAKIMQDSKDWRKFVGIIGAWEDQYIHSYYEWTFSEQYAELIEERSAHPIYSQYTEQKVATLLKYNPEFTDVYLSKYISPYLLLTHQPIEPILLSEKKKHQLKVQLWLMIISLIPPREFVETADYVRGYCEQITRDIEQTRMHINLALARPFDENPD